MSRRAPKGTPTALNIFALAQVFGWKTRIANRIHSTDTSHVRRCFDAGLVKLAEDGTKDLVLTPSGEEAVAKNILGRLSMHGLVSILPTDYFVSLSMAKMAGAR